MTRSGASSAFNLAMRGVCVQMDPQRDTIRSDRVGLAASTPYTVPVNVRREHSSRLGPNRTVYAGGRMDCSPRPAGCCGFDRAKSAHFLDNVAEDANADLMPGTFRQVTAAVSLDARPDLVTEAAR